MPAVTRRRRRAGVLAAPVSVFALGYLLVWTGFALVAALAQSALHPAALLSPAMASSSPLLGGALLLRRRGLPVAAGQGRLSLPLPLPAGILLRASGAKGCAGALVMGLRHGSYCVGCCWALMALLFVAGVMNLLWVAVIAGFVLAEKVVPHGRLLGRITGGLLVLWGVWVLLYPAATKL